MTAIDKLAEKVGIVVVRYAGTPNLGLELGDLLSTSPPRDRDAVHLNLILFFAWGAMKKAVQLIGEYPPMVQAFTDRMCETVYAQVGQIEPLLHDRWARFSECDVEDGPQGLRQLAKALDACCGDAIADPNRIRAYSMNPQLHMRIAIGFAGFMKAIEIPFVEELADT